MRFAVLNNSTTNTDNGMIQAYIAQSRVWKIMTIGNHEINNSQGESERIIKIKQ